MIVENFPKTRTELPKRLEEIHSENYKLNREGKTSASFLSQKMESWMHRQVASDVTASSRKKTLEIGAGTLNQLNYEPGNAPYDIVEPWDEIYKDSPQSHKVRNTYSDIFEVPMDSEYDRITSIATFEHICNLPRVVARCGLLLKKDGVLRCSIPSEGTFLWKLGWKLTTGLEFKLKYGYDYGRIIEYEHVNTAKEIEDVLDFFFEDLSYRVFGLSKSSSFYRFYACSKSRKEKCIEFGKRQNK